MTVEPLSGALAVAVLSIYDVTGNLKDFEFENDFENGDLKFEIMVLKI